MTPALLREAGELLYGPRWQTDLARDLDVSLRTIRRWGNGEWPVPEGAWADLLEVAGERAGALKAFLARNDPQHRRENK